MFLFVFASLSRSKNKTITDWPHEHREYIREWNEGRGREIDLTAHDANAFDKYLAWLHGATRLHLRRAWTDHDILDRHLTRSVIPMSTIMLSGRESV